VSQRRALPATPGDLRGLDHRRVVVHSPPRTHFGDPGSASPEFDEEAWRDWIRRCYGFPLTQHVPWLLVIRTSWTSSATCPLAENLCCVAHRSPPKRLACSGAVQLIDMVGVPVNQQPHRPPAVPSQQPAELDEMEQWWDYALQTARSLRSGHSPITVDVWGPLLRPNENGHLMVTLEYSRYYGANATYRHNNLFVGGKTEFVVGAFAVNMLLNESRRTAAQKFNAVQWRNHQQSPVIVTSQRVMCNTTKSGWMSFDYSRVTEFVPDLDHWSVSFDFSGDAGPLRLRGPAAPAVALLTAQALLGGRWTSDPRLARLQ
jgi:hypothetical protein